MTPYYPAVCKIFTQPKCYNLYSAKNNTTYFLPPLLLPYLLFLLKIHDAINFESFKKLNSSESIEILVHSDNYCLISKRFELSYFI